MARNHEFRSWLAVGTQTKKKGGGKKGERSAIRRHHLPSGEMVCFVYRLNLEVVDSVSVVRLLLSLVGSPVPV